MRWWRRMDIESKRLRYRCWFTFSSTRDLLLRFRCLPFYAQKCAAAPGPPPPRYERSTVKATFRLPPQVWTKVPSIGLSQHERNEYK